MQPFDSISRLENLAFLDKVAAPLRGLVDAVIRPQPLRDALHGTWLGHPVHPMAVQVPIGAWLSAAVLDALPGTEAASTALVATGVAAAAPAVATGYTDWSATGVAEQRVGVVHSLANAVGLGLYGASLVARLRGDQRRGKALAYAGLGAVAAGGVLGGHLAYAQASGPSHAAELRHLVSAGWRPLGRLDALPDGRLHRVELDGQPLLVLRRGRDVLVTANKCSHLSAPLDEGELTDLGGEPCVVCPWHGSTFRLRDGSVVHGPAASPQPSFEVRLAGDEVEVRLPGAG